MPKSEITLWMINQYAVPPTMFGGTRHFDFARELIKKDVNVKILASSFNNNLRKETIDYGQSFFKRERFDNVEFIWIKSMSYKSNGLDRVFNMLTFCRNLYRVMRNETPRADVIIGSSPHLFAAYVGLVFARRFKRKFIFEIRDIWPLSLTDLGKNKNHPMIRVFAMLEKKLIMRSDKIIALMPKGKEYLTENFEIPSQKVVWISNGVDLKNFPIHRQKKIAKKFLVRYTGTIGEVNDLELVVDTAEILQKSKSNIKIELFGDGVLKEKLNQKISDLKLNNISIERPVAKKKLHKVLQESDALLFTLKKADVFKYGNPPNKIFDYLSAGKPIIFSSCASNNLIAQSKSGISVNPGNAQKLAEAIVKMSKISIKDRAKMGQRARIFVESKYQVKDLARKLYEVLIDLHR